MRTAMDGPSAEERPRSRVDLQFGLDPTVGFLEVSLRPAWYTKYPYSYRFHPEITRDAISKNLRPTHGSLDRTPIRQGRGILSARCAHAVRYGILITVP